MDATYGKEHRLRRKRDLDDVYRRGRRWIGALLRLHVRANGLDVSRLAVSTPKKLCGAVERNRWKRLLRESFRLHKERIGPGLDLIVVPLKVPGGLKRGDVDAVLLDLVGRHRAAKR